MRGNAKPNRRIIEFRKLCFRQRRRGIVDNRRVVLIHKFHATAKVGTQIEGDHLVEGAHSRVRASATVISALGDVVDEVHALQRRKDGRLHRVVVQPCHPSASSYRAVQSRPSGNRRSRSTPLSRRITTTRSAICLLLYFVMSNTRCFFVLLLPSVNRCDTTKPTVLLGYHRLVLEVLDTVQSLGNHLLHSGIKFL